MKLNIENVEIARARKGFTIEQLCRKLRSFKGKNDRHIKPAEDYDAMCWQTCKGS